MSAATSVTESCLLANGARYHLALSLVGSMQEQKLCGVQKELLSSECVGHGDRRWGYFRAGCRKAKVKAKSFPKACTFKLLGERYIEYAGDWKRKEFAKLCNSIGCSRSNYWPGSNLPPTCSYRSRQLVLVQAWDMLLHPLHAFSSGKLTSEIGEQYILLQILYIYIAIH